MLVHPHYDAAIEQLTDCMERYHSIIAMAPSPKAGLEQFKARNGGKFYLKNADSTLTAAEIQEIAKAVNLPACRLSPKDVRIAEAVSFCTWSLKQPLNNKRIFH